MIHGVSFRLLHDPPLDQITALFKRLRADGADAIAIIPHHYVSLVPGTPNLTRSPFAPSWFIWPDRGQDPGHPFRNTPEPETVYDACQAAQAAGLQVLLKPHIDSYQADWRGNISVQHVAADWAWGYRHRFLQRYIDIARQVNGTILSLGCELYTVTKELGPEFWIDLAAWVREQGFHGPLTYAANWGNNSDAEFLLLRDLWPHLDYVGVDAYFPLVADDGPDAPDLATLVAGWHRQPFTWMPATDDLLLQAATHAGKPLLFTEVGFPNRLGAAKTPYRDTQPGDVRDDAAQTLAARAFRARWDSEPQCAGSFWWEAWLGPDPLPSISHDILGKPAEAVVFGSLPGEA